VIEGRVAQILNDRELIINRGRKDGVTGGMAFDVLMGNPLQVNDPETGESLGILERSKASVRVSEVHEKFAVCEGRRLTGPRESRIAPEGFFAPGGAGYSGLRRSSRVDTPSRHEIDVRVGDRVRQTSQAETVPFQAQPSF
jgi:hypothetical protein